MTPDLNHIYQGDCLDVMREWPANFVDTIITDPPYGLGFMGKDWDHGVPGPHFWAEALRIAKPGAMFLAFGGTRTYHRLAVAIEDAGWQIRDCLMWLYGSGFPKSHDISKALDRKAGAEREIVGYKHQGPRSMFDGGKPRPTTRPATLWDGWGTALKPAWEPIILAMKPLDGTFADNAETWGVAGLNVDGGRIATSSDRGRLNKNDNGMFGVGKGPSNQYGKPIEDQGRWPANLILDEDAAAMLDGQSDGQIHGAGYQREADRNGPIKGMFGMPSGCGNRFGDSSGASRFFYIAKSARAERNEGCEEMPFRQSEVDLPQGGIQEDNPRGHLTKNHHPTVKPLELMKYLVNLTRTPTGGLVLDPFCGSGTTLWAAESHNRPWIGIELESEYVTIANARIAKERAQIKMALEPKAVAPTLVHPSPIPRQTPLFEPAEALA